MALGGALDVNANKLVAIRIFQTDYLPSRHPGVWSKRDFRAAVGVSSSGGRRKRKAQTLRLKKKLDIRARRQFMCANELG